MQFPTGMLYNKEEKEVGREKIMNKTLYAYAYLLFNKNISEEEKEKIPE